MWYNRDQPCGIWCQMNTAIKIYIRRIGRCWWSSSWTEKMFWSIKKMNMVINLVFVNAIIVFPKFPENKVYKKSVRPSFKWRSSSSKSAINILVNLKKNFLMLWKIISKRRNMPLGDQSCNTGRTQKHLFFLCHFCDFM